MHYVLYCVVPWEHTCTPWEHTCTVSTLHRHLHVDTRSPPQAPHLEYKSWPQSKNDLYRELFGFEVHPDSYPDTRNSQESSFIEATELPRFVGPRTQADQVRTVCARSAIRGLQEKALQARERLVCVFPLLRLLGYAVLGSWVLVHSPYSSCARDEWVRVLYGAAVCPLGLLGLKCSVTLFFVIR